MTPEQKAAYINSQATAAKIAAMGMEAENQQRIRDGMALAYLDKDFFNLIQEYGLGSNNVVGYLQSEL